jgi:hypothetical protein
MDTCTYKIKRETRHTWSLSLAGLVAFCSRICPSRDPHGAPGKHIDKEDFGCHYTSCAARTTS